MTTTRPAALAGPIDQALDSLCAEHLRPAERIVYAVLTLLAANEGEPALRAEIDVAAWTGMSPHQARQAIAGLRRHGLVEREWFMFGDRPTAGYRVLPWTDPR